MIIDPFLMISDIFHCAELDSWFEHHPDEPFCFYEHKTESWRGHWIGIVDRTINEDWFINYSEDDGEIEYNVIMEGDSNYTELKKGEFFDWLQEEYPAHFEWFLWHPELM